MHVICSRFLVLLSFDDFWLRVSWHLNTFPSVFSQTMASNAPHNLSIQMASLSTSSSNTNSSSTPTSFEMSPYNKPGTLSTRIRRNVKDLSPEEWGKFVNALKVMKTRTRPGGVVSIYDEFTALHMGAVEMNRNWRRSHGHFDGLCSSKDGPADPAHDNPG